MRLSYDVARKFVPKNAWLQHAWVLHANCTNHKSLAREDLRFVCMRIDIIYVLMHTNNGHASCKHASTSSKLVEYKTVRGAHGQSWWHYAEKESATSALLLPI